MTAESLVGVWHLTAIERPAGLDDYGSAPTGRIVYDHAGGVLTLIIPPGSGGGNGYIGRYEVDGDLVTHVVEAATNPTYDVGLRLSRRFTIVGDRLVLVADDGTRTVFDRVGRPS